MAERKEGKVEQEGKAGGGQAEPGCSGCLDRRALQRTGREVTTWCLQGKE